MNFFEIFKFLPKPALFVFPIALAVLALAVFSLFEKRKTGEKEISQPDISLTAAFKEPSPKKKKFENLLIILTILLLLLSLPLALFLVKQRSEIRMRAETPSEVTPTPSPSESFSLTPTPSPTSGDELTPTPTPPQCDKIKVYDENWLEIEKNDLPNLQPGQIIRIAVKGSPAVFDKGRIRINQMEWTAENETTTQKPDSPGEFYLECKVGVVKQKATICGISAGLDDTFKIEAELHDKNTGKWR